MKNEKKKKKCNYEEGCEIKLDANITHLYHFFSKLYFFGRVSTHGSTLTNVEIYNLMR